MLLLFFFSSSFCSFIYFLYVLFWAGVLEANDDAMQLFDNKAAKGKVSSGTSKESVIQDAGEMAMKMYLKSQGQQQGGILGLASKFM